MTRLLVLACAALLATTCAAAPRDGGDPPAPPPGAAVQQFIDSAQRFTREANEKGLSGPPRWEAYEEFIDNETLRLQPLMPEAMRLLGQHLAHRTEDEKRLDELLTLENPTDERLDEISGIMDAPSASKSVPRCAIGFVIGGLGRESPQDAVDLLFTAVPLPERTEDECIIRSLMMLGPGAYEAIEKHVRRDSSSLRVYIGTVSIVAQAAETSFPPEVGLGPRDEWDETFPTSKRKQRKLAGKFVKWWESNQHKYEWNSKQHILEPRSEP